MKMEKNEVLKLALAHRDFVFKEQGFVMQKGQREVSDAIVKSNLFGEGKEIFHEVSRQAGKTTILVWTTIFLLMFLRGYQFLILGENTKKKFELGIFAPQREQAKTAFDRLKEALSKMNLKYNFSYEEANGNTLKIHNSPYDSIVYTFALSPTSQIESKSMDFQLFDESQKIEDDELKNKALPMTMATGGTRCFIGTSGKKLCYFYYGLNRKDEKTEQYVYDVYEIIEQKEEMFEKTSDFSFLNYKSQFEQEVKRHGIDSDYIKTQYLLKWILGKGMFVTPKQMEEICLNIPIIKEDKINDVFIGIDCAKENDDMVVTAWRWQMFKRKEWDAPKKCVRVLDWFVLNKELYSDQWEIVEDQFLRHYNISKINIDSTGVGDGTADWFIRRYDNVDYDTYKKRESQGNRGIVRGVKFTPQSKNKMYRELLMLIDNGLFIVPKDENSFGYNKFVKESKILLKEYKGDLLSVHHDDVPGATDDCWDSIACSIYDHDLVPIHGNSKVVVGKFIRDPQLISENKGITEKWLNKRLKLAQRPNKYI